MKRTLLLFTLLGMLLTACSGSKYKIYNGMALGTTYRIIVNDPPSDMNARIEQVFEKADSFFSIFNPNSVVSSLNNNTNRLINRNILECLQIAAEVNQMSGGLYDITVKPVVDAWGFGSGRKNPSEEYIDSLMQYVGFSKLDFESVPGILRKSSLGVQIDLSSVAKGYTVDMMARMIMRLGINDFLIEVGGEIYCRGVNPRGKTWTVGIDMPVDGNGMLEGHSVNKLQAVIDISNRAVATSGNYRNFYIDEQGNKIVHTINPRTGRPVKSNVLSVTVIDPICARADAYATALMAAGGLEQIKNMTAYEQNIAYYVIYSDEKGFFRTYATPSFQKYITKEE